MRMSKDYKAKIADIIQQINALFGDKSVDKRTTLVAMEQIEEAAQANVDVLEDEIRKEDRED